MVPTDTPVTIPEDIFINATDKLLLVQLPPVTGFVRVILLPTHTDPGPAIGAGDASTVNNAVAVHPDTVYEMVLVPMARPSTKPVNEPIVAVVGLLLLQVPDGEAFVSVVVSPAHRCSKPAMVSGDTVTTVETEQLVGNVYTTVAVPPLSPDTTPAADPTATIPTLVAAHIPPATELLRVDVLPLQTVVLPVIGPGERFTVIILLVLQPPGSV